VSLPEQDRAGYVSFWDDVAANFPSLKGAPSTQYYLECERMLCAQFFPPLAGRLLFKTDLWDEAKNTEILRWAAEQGARPAGVDIALGIVQEARKVFGERPPGFVVADIRAIPFRSHSIDLVYSMGTIEHFPDYAVSVQELFRVLKPGGTAIIGVPNTLDPFLRPLMVWLLQRCGLYAYGAERSFTAGGLRALLESAGFRHRATSGILFIPGWLRMLDLWCHTRCPRLTRLTGWLVGPFAWLYRRVPAVRRHGYLLACVVDKPQ
jgi:SAM-dependent methyltransferase